MVLFKYGQSLTLAVINRRLHKRDERKDVLEKVILIKDINIENPHRAHIEILFDLSFSELLKKHKFTNFVDLHNAWQKTLDTKELNKRFYQELFNWYLWASKNVRFPQIRPEEDFIDDQVHQSESLIRLLTRLLFCWFMKEKGLIKDELFKINSLKDILKNFQGSYSDETIYYKAILQNLFFATLSKPINERKVIKNVYPNPEYGDPLVYRYMELFKNEKDILKYFENIPFLNGGLFDCLDSRKDKSNPVEIRLDGFSQTKSKQPVVPDKLFFGVYKDIDLSSEYDDKKKSNQTVHGLIDILHGYKFTIEENTPVEEEIALDPELLGKVFENLLASYNPETKTTARKQTGSFFTPREIVNYMVDESLIAYLEQQMKDHIPELKEMDSLNEVFREVLSYTEKEHPFNDKEVDILIRALDNIKILDPACGSGAFIMGMLQKMLHLLRKIDPENKQWFEKVISKFPAYLQIEMRNKLQQENWDYVRKLGIIQECIYGVDIQPIAIQIAKLRFFISLLVDQQEKSEKENRGFEPLPNLDFKLVAANTLISVPQFEHPNTELFASLPDTFFEKFDDLTGKYFSTYIPDEKKRLKDEISLLINKKCQGNIKAIENLSTHYDARFSKVYAEKHKKEIREKDREVKLWDSYKNLFKHEAVGFFEPKYFFPKAADGFDVVIGNPPYIKEYTFRSAFDGLRDSPYYQGKMDLWYLFVCKNLDFLKKKTGVLCFIATNNWTTNAGASKMRAKILNDSTVHFLLDFGSYMIFESSDIQTMVMLFRNYNANDNYNFELRRLVGNRIVFDDVLDLITKKQTEKTEYLIPVVSKENLKDKSFTFSNDVFETILNKIKTKGNFLLTENEVANGIHPHYDYVSKATQKVLGDTFKVGQGIFVLSDDEKKDLGFSKREFDLIKPYYTTKQIRKWYGNSENDEWIIYTDSKFKYAENIKPYPNIKNHLDKFQKVITSDNKPYGLHRAREEYFFKGEKIIVLRKCANEPMFTYTDFDCYVSATFYVIKSERINLKYLTAILNSKLIAFWLRNKGKMQGNNYQLDKEPLLQIPLYSSNETKPFEFVVNYILLKQNPTFFERLIDAMVYELYFTSEIKAANCEILKHLTTLPEIKDGWSDEQKLQTIEKVYKELSDPAHPVSVAMEKMKTVPEVRIIEGLDKE
jgi:transcription antitermination factor NusG